MDAIEAIKTRRSIREFKDEPIPKEILESLVDAGRMAATARNVQPWEFVAVTKKQALKKIASLAENGRFIAEASACIAIFSIDTKYYLEDGCAATENILLASHAQGLGACWVAGDKKPYCPEVSSLLGAPASLKLVSLIALGYAKSAKPVAISKKPLKDLLHWEKF